MNSHIDVSKIDQYTAKEYDIAKYENMVKFYGWLQAQTTRYANGKQALQAYRNVTTETTAVEAPQSRPLPTFKSRQQLNSYLRRNGYCWQKTTAEDMDAFGADAFSQRYGDRQDFVWELIAPDFRTITVNQALEEITNG